MRDLSDKVAWITGAGTGIGEAGAIALADAGMHVVLSGRRAEMLEAVAGCPLEEFADDAGPGFISIV